VTTQPQLHILSAEDTICNLPLHCTPTAEMSGYEGESMRYVTVSGICD
jgi:hypothetical protein